MHALPSLPEQQDMSLPEQQDIDCPSAVLLWAQQEPSFISAMFWQQPAFAGESGEPPSAGLEFDLVWPHESIVRARVRAMSARFIANLLVAIWFKPGEGER